jgi:hypothetical protein
MMNYLALMGAVVALVVGAFLVYTTMTMAITQRRPVISMLRAIGGRRATIVRDMLAEAAILGVIGGAIGSGIGILLGRTAIGRLPRHGRDSARVGTGGPARDTGRAGGGGARQRGRVGDGGAAGVQVSPIEACTGRGFGGRSRATMAADRMRVGAAVVFAGSI